MQTVAEMVIPGEWVLRPRLPTPFLRRLLGATERRPIIADRNLSSGVARNIGVGRNADVDPQPHRNQLGLKDVGSMSGETRKAASEYQIGDRLGIFTIVGRTRNELLLGIDDSHLDLRVSVLKPSGKSSLNYVVSASTLAQLARSDLYSDGRIPPRVVRAVMRRTAV